MNYVGLTIGPIYKTLQNSKKPNELWAASFVFSYIMKQIIKEFKSREFVVPYIKDESIFDETMDIGLFHDRFIFKSLVGDMQLLTQRISDVLKELSKDLNIEESFLKNYFQINFKELDVQENPILELTPYLDSLELFYEVSQYDTNLLQQKLKEKDNFLLKNRTHKVNSLTNIASNNYIAIVHVDGDKMGEVIEDKNNIENVSKNLFNYCKASHKLITHFGGETIFAGGDDLLFFAPIINNAKSKTIFNLCDEISKDFDAKFNNKATLSFGVHISYEKFPLYEALEESRNLLFAKAKTQQKNNIAFRVRKHSGQTFETLIHKGNKEIYENFLLFTSNIIGGDGIDNFLHSLHHKIDNNKETINQIADSKEKLNNFFENYFNKDEHTQYKEFFEQLIEFIHNIFKDKSIKEDEKLNIIYSTLRFVKFIQGDKI
jgi:CRISPR-associated protein Cmr2